MWAEAMRDYLNYKIVLKKDCSSDCVFFWCIYNCKKKMNLTKIKMIPCFAFSPCYNQFVKCSIASTASNQHQQPDVLNFYVFIFYEDLNVVRKHF